MTTSGYDDFGNLVTTDGPLSGTDDTTHVRYDAGYRRIGVISPDPDGAGARKRAAQRITYNADGQPTEVELGTVTDVTDTAWSAFSSQQKLTTTYDTGGRKVKDVATGGSTTYQVTQYSYDGEGRLDCSTIRMNSATWGALPASACTAQTAGPDRITKNTYDNADRMTKVTTAYGTTAAADDVTTTYTDNGKAATVTDAEGNRTTYEYDGHDRLAKTRYPLSTTDGMSSTTDYEQLTYDAASNVTSRRLRDGNALGYAYDALNRMTQLTTADQDVTFGKHFL